MGYNNMFGSRRQFIDNSTDDDTSTPSADLLHAAKDVTVKPEQKPLRFEGFGSTLPLLLERPSKYIQRMTGAARNMIQTADGSPAESRILFSPVVSLPFFVLDGSEKFANEDVLKYPLLHAPANHPLTDPEQLDVYVLTLITMYVTAGMLAEDYDGSVYTYGVEGEFEIADDVWAAAEEWSKDVAPIIREINLARIAQFASLAWEEEQPAFEMLEQAWGVNPDDWQPLADKMPENVDLLKHDYDIITNLPFEPYSELSSQYEQELKDKAEEAAAPMAESLI
ncbi:hypothetical protein [Bifidobacterium callitrichidarum]|uniref:Uncharacterized protein n=1 Tax=Bifidobacterium callitrichidarum TaxID=2052941 RepID=A0A2U2N095_9BIFI|nr:hypothetical protein [Bifidobacterium callitrichidarum]PWG62665.1 hypothetical protein DF196_11950 [Bifidobacterium callitrichidarum]